MNYIRVQWDRVGAGLCVMLGVIVLIIGWAGTSNTEYVAKQMPYIISGGIAGIFLLGVGAVLWISADLRDEWREMRTLSVQIRQEQVDRRATAESTSIAMAQVEPIRDTPARARRGSSRVAATK